ncbi:type I restriction-modification system subunit M [Leptolinea tardivitalis]|uniref:site-specific DNA-methyltransferase (adenine-specific) n=1 Tax=Leptolinea tardivitalis TaxID=229920 RepID=A0A0P6X020_9CHLR|nr:class I SAM-dependent DNA methyltransferase [Leptolinea tardivitalis]KPL72483.1 restriction endonuclease subunit M [Leptolinea tardivitalis]GAP21235.1 type I restriction-modification system methyltransferase subunit [Leptolinea tardivitalis]
MANNNNFTEKVNFLWSVADLIRDTFRRSKYQDVILPLTVLRRIDCVLEPTKSNVLKAYAKYKGKIPNLDPVLRKASGYVFYNITPFTFEKLLEDPNNLAANLLAYINGFSENMREVVEKFDFRNTITKLDEAGLLFLVVEKFKNIDLHPDVVDNHEMGTIFEELIRRFNEALDENPGEHFTPREVIRLMVDLLVGPENGKLTQEYRVIKVADPACGSGGMLTIAKERLLERNPTLQVHIYGQEINPETFAMCKADLYMKSEDGKDAENIAYGSSLSHEAHPAERFDYQLANPPYGKEWKMDEKEVKAEAVKPNGRFAAGLPRISDGQMLFLQHMLSRMNPPEQGGGRVAIVLNGSPLFTGDAGSGESEIRRWIIENDWLEAIIALPEQLFYNTGIATYIWVLNNRKKDFRKGKVQLIDATGIWTPMRKSLGNKRREITDEQITHIYSIFEKFEETNQSKIFDTVDFGYRKVTIERPLRLAYQASPERIARLKEQTAFIGLAQSKKKSGQEKLEDVTEGRRLQEQILEMLKQMPQEIFFSRSAFEQILDQTCKKEGIKLDSPIRKAILVALSEREESAEICLDKDGNPEPDPSLRDTENVPLKEDIGVYFEREVKPHIPDAWINSSLQDPKDGKVGMVGYEINFNRHFYIYTPPRKLEEIELEIKSLQAEITQLLGEFE